MSLFNFGKSKKERPEWVMAYLEEAMYLQFPFTLTNQEGIRVTAYLTEMDEEAGSGEWKLEGPLFAQKGDEVAMTVVFGELRIGASARILETRARAVILELPGLLELAEQRKTLRARFTSSELVDFTALTGLYEGIGLLGAVENVSAEGCRLRVSKAMLLKTQAPVRLVPSLLAVGQPLVVLKLKKLPKCPSVLDFSGHVVYLEATSRHLFVGVKFEATPAESAGYLAGVLAKRVGELPDSIPEKARRKVAKAPEKPAPRPITAAPSGASEPESRAPAAPEPVPTPIPGTQAPSPAPSAVLRLKKRARILAILAPPERGEVLRDYLQQEGYGKIFLARKPAEIKELTHQHSLNLVFMDCMTPLIQSLDILAELHRELPAAVPLVVAVDDIAVSRSPKVQNLGISAFVPKPYVLDAAFSEMLERALGLR